MKKENRDERESGERPHDFVSERFAPDANNRDGDNGHNGRLQSVEDRGDRRDIAERGVNITQRPKNKDRRNDKKRSGNDAAPGSVQEPANINRELLRFGAGKQHAKIERMKETRLADPLLFLDQLRLHDRDLAGGSAKRDESEF